MAASRRPPPPGPASAQRFSAWLVPFLYWVLLPCVVRMLQLQRRGAAIGAAGELLLLPRIVAARALLIRGRGSAIDASGALLCLPRLLAAKASLVRNRRMKCASEHDAAAVLLPLPTRPTARASLRRKCRIAYASWRDDAATQRATSTHLTGEDAAPLAATGHLSGEAAAAGREALLGAPEALQLASAKSTPAMRILSARSRVTEPQLRYRSKSNGLSLDTGRST